jgi:hypothetical protein
MVVRGRAPPRERAGMRRQHRARADRDQLDAATLEALAAQPVQQVLCLGVVDGDGLAGQADEHDPGGAVPLRGQGREPGERDADRGHGRRPRAGELDRETLGPARRHEPLVRDPQRLGRPGPVEHEAAGEQHENYADGWLLLWVHA